jgi:hypothetical protein
MRYGLIRFRGHGTEVTFESTLPLDSVIPAVAGFMAEHFGPLTWVRFSQLPDGPCVGSTCQDLECALEAGDLGANSQQYSLGSSFSRVVRNDVYPL